MPDIPETVVEAAANRLWEYLVEGDRMVVPATMAGARDVARAVLGDIRPVVFPGMYVTSHGGDLTVWRENPDHPNLPTALLQGDLERILARLLPDRTDGK